MSVQISHAVQVSVCRGRAYMRTTTTTRSSGQRGSRIYVLNIIYIYFIVFFTVFCRWYMGMWETARVCVWVLCDPTAFLRRVHNRVRWAFGRRNGNNKTEFVSFRMLKNTNPFIIIHSISHSKHCWMRGNKFARISRTSPSSEASSR